MGYKVRTLKKLQETQEENWNFTSFAQMEGVIRRAQNPASVVLLLHGLHERGKRIYRKLLPYLPADATVIAPNGPFPLPRHKDGRVSYGHSWYFFDKAEQKYFIDQTLAKFWLRDLLEIENPKKLPVTIIGFSQGGYLAPLAGNEIKETNLVIGLACEFRSTLIREKLPFKLVQIHGEEDEVVKLDWAKEQISILDKTGINVELHTVHATHEINSQMAEKIKSIMDTYAKRSL